MVQDLINDDKNDIVGGLLTMEQISLKQKEKQQKNSDIILLVELHINPLDFEITFFKSLGVKADPL